MEVEKVNHAPTDGRRVLRREVDAELHEPGELVGAVDHVAQMSPCLLLTLLSLLSLLPLLPLLPLLSMG